jgi:hypothetical protein
VDVVSRAHSELDVVSRTHSELDVVCRAMWLVAVVVAVGALAACRIAPLDYEGKDCPCPNGWQCNLVTGTCTAAGAPDSGNQAPDGNGNGDAASAGDSCLANPRTNLLYASMGFSDFPAAWLQASGQWAKDGAEVRSTNSANPLAWLSHTVQTNSGMANYRVVATMRFINSLDPAPSIGIGFRISTQATLYTCTFDPASGELELAYSQGGVDAPLLSKKLSPVPSDPRFAFTMEVMTIGNVQSCCVRGFANSLLTTNASFAVTGNPGVVTRVAEGAFSTFYVFE